MIKMREWIQGREHELAGFLIDGLGFKSHQAHEFVRETGKSVLKTISGDTNLDLHSLRSPTTLVALYNRTDIGGVARRVGVPEDTARAGLKNILPRLLETLDESAGRFGGVRPMMRQLD